jgi:hypothetical protein
MRDGKLIARETEKVKCFTFRIMCSDFVGFQTGVRRIYVNVRVLGDLTPYSLVDENVLEELDAFIFSCPLKPSKLAYILKLPDSNLAGISTVRTQDFCDLPQTL